MDIFQPYETYRGLTFSYQGGKLKYIQTMLQLNLLRFYRDIFSFDADGCDLVITDFEPLSARIARRNKLPLIGIAHQYAFAYDIPVDGCNPLARFVIRKYASADFPIGLHWHHFRQPILPPIVSHHIEQNRKIKKNKIVVYLPFENPKDIISLLKEFQRYEFFVYHGFKQAKDQKNFHLRPYSRTGFIDDLAECNGVICNAGFELVSEALHLGKKILVKPLAGQMEQLSNAKAISLLKMGMAMKNLEKEKVAQFLDIPNACAEKYPKVARMNARWDESGQWEDLEGLAKTAWEQTASPVRSLC
jgi:uncharacterized protein (TIGR00661 family)